MPGGIRDLINRNAKDAARIEISHKELTVPSIEQRYYEVKSHAKLEVLHRLIDHNNVRLGIIFCNTKKGVDELVEHLQARGYSVDRLHGDMAQGMRQRVMQKFRDGQLELLVATDVAARGLDIDNVEVVFNYDLPHDEEDYVHRIGRTDAPKKRLRDIDCQRTGSLSFAAYYALHQSGYQAYGTTDIGRGGSPPDGCCVWKAAGNFAKG
ncbi:MAG: DEAD/DEAH box helicase [Verrucomicrobia bacterium]|nr:DEAD/DEAH box helicase [Verrucomicrobiota bacterium]